eukprot:6210577-Pleurochrysis_carterae.AAC.1
MSAGRLVRAALCSKLYLKICATHRPYTTPSWSLEGADLRNSFKRRFPARYSYAQDRSKRFQWISPAKTRFLTFVVVINYSDYRSWSERLHALLLASLRRSLLVGYALTLPNLHLIFVVCARGISIARLHSANSYEHKHALYIREYRIGFASKHMQHTS